MNEWMNYNSYIHTSHHDANNEYNKLIQYKKMNTIKSGPTANERSKCHRKITTKTKPKNFPNRMMLGFVYYCWGRGWNMATEMGMRQLTVNP